MRKIASVLVLMLAAAAATVAAQEPVRAPMERPRTAAPPANAVPALLQEIGLDQKLNEQLPLSLTFRDESGREVALGDFFGERPVILALVYYECPMLCNQVLNGLTSALTVMNLNAGRDFDVVAVSFDPGETPELARAKKASYVERYGRDGAEAGWHFLTGDEREISALTRAVGFRYAYNAEVDQYAHPSGVMVATPEGRLSHYFYGIEYAPRDLRLAIVEASERRIGSPVDQLLLACFHYDPSSGKYSLAVMRLIRIAGVITLVAIGGTIVLLRRRERQQPSPGSPRD
ncbi:MAG TPA: SCO family protein [Vicinamibacterales bacterium]